MKATTILRIACFLALIQYAAHGSLFLIAASTHGPGVLARIAASRIHSYWDLYLGYGLMAILSGVIEVVLLWQLSLLAKTDAERIRPMLALFVFANVAHAALIWKYFSLLAPVVFDLLIATLLCFAFVAARGKATDNSASPQELGASPQ